jgi:hypothetical protein
MDTTRNFLPVCRPVTGNPLFFYSLNLNLSSLKLRPRLRFRKNPELKFSASAFKLFPG